MCLYDTLSDAGKAPHAAYLTAFCSAAGGGLLVRTMEQGMPVSGAHRRSPGAAQLLPGAVAAPHAEGSRNPHPDLCRLRAALPQAARARPCTPGRWR